MVFSKGRALSPPAKPVFRRARFFSAVSLLFSPLVLFSSSPLGILFRFFFFWPILRPQRPELVPPRADCSTFWSSIAFSFPYFHLSQLPRSYLIITSHHHLSRYPKAYPGTHVDWMFSPIISPFSKIAPERKRSYRNPWLSPIRYFLRFPASAYTYLLRLHVAVPRAKRRQFLTRRDAPN